MRSRVIVLALIVSVLMMLTVGTLSASASGGCRKHHVKWGETLYSIGRMYNVSPWAIAAYNGIHDPDYIKGGTYICVPYGPPYPDHYPHHQKHYVRFGETLFSIGRLYNVDPYAIAHVNGLSDPNYVKGGTMLYIPSGPPYPGDHYKHYDGYYGGHYDGYYDGHYDGHYAGYYDGHYDGYYGGHYDGYYDGHYGGHYDGRCYSCRAAYGYPDP